MVEIISVKEYARLTGRSLEDVETIIDEAENGTITRNMLDPGTLRKFN